LLGAACIEEYSRKYLAEKGSKYSAEDLDTIAGEQFRSTLVAQKSNNRFLIADTDMHTMAVWSMEKYGSVSSVIGDLLQQEEFDLYLLCRPDIPWQYDPLRENPNDRERLFDAYFHSLVHSGRNFEIVDGLGDLRLARAFEILKKHFGEIITVP
jgi:nicotinamide riboside kinase